MSQIMIKRIYEAASSTDGIRILVDRLWPRGVTKEKAQLTFWIKEVAPSPELRVWFQHKPERFAAFAEQYRAELAKVETAPYLQQIKNLAKQNSVKLLYAAKDEQVNHAIILKQYLDQLQE